MSTNSDRRIQFCFPDTGNFSSSDEFLAALVELSHEPPTADGQKRWGGFFGTTYLQTALKGKFDENYHKKYTPLSTQEKKHIRQIIETTAKTCQSKLPTPAPPLRIFAYPWSAGDPALAGVNGTTFWQNTFHLYIDNEVFTEKSLRHTVAHEYNHAIYNNNDFKRTILQPIVMEGLAEHFREDILGGDMADWSLALNKQEAAEALKAIKDNGHLYVTTGDDAATYSDYRELYSSIFYGHGDTYKKWTGYAVGYWLVKIFRDTHPEKSWPELMQLAPEAYLSSLAS